MKRSHYFPWMGLIPLALGGCYVYSVAIPVVGTLLFTLLPWVMVLAWAWLGMDCGRQRRPFWLSLLAGHWGVLLSVLCGAWQFWLLVVWGGIASAVLLILIFTVSYWVGRRIAKAP